MAKKDRGTGISLDSLLDILTCLLGVLMLIIISTGIDAAQTKILIPTPMEYQTDKKPLYIECRNNEMLLVPVERLREQVRAKLDEIGKGSKGEFDTLQKMSSVDIVLEGFKVDLTYSLIGNFAVRPDASTKGYRLDNWTEEKETGWFKSLIDKMDKDKEMIVFLVRDDSYKVFKNARRLAWEDNVDVSFALLAYNEPIKFGLGGSNLLAQ